eukprot:5462745-Amphidinium_carterae.1
MEEKGQPHCFLSENERCPSSSDTEGAASFSSTPPNADFGGLRHDTAAHVRSAAWTMRPRVGVVFIFHIKQRCPPIKAAFLGI